MKIFMIKGNNDEIYEDYYEWVESIWVDKDNAKNELKELRKKAAKDYKKDPYYKRIYKIIELETKD